LLVSIKNIQTAHLVHDLKNPVNIIETGARSLLDKQDRYGKLSESQEKIVRRLLRNALKLRHLANSMLEVDMATMGLVRKCDCTLAGIMKSALIEVFDIVDPKVSDALDGAKTFESFQEVLRDNDIVLDADESQMNRTIHVDETKMSLIVTNLLSNAFKYKQKCVHIHCSSDTQGVQIAVRDDGPGIPECYHQQIFDQYFQCSKIEGFPVRGHGLGLAGALALTEAIGGVLSLCNSPQGAEFRVQVNVSNH
jgi:two-component system, OmpR family, sensor kinase